jgi:hypothetical protein
MAWLKCEFMLDKIGETFDGVITADRLRRPAQTFVEGSRDVLENDYYGSTLRRHRLVGARSKKVYQLAAPPGAGGRGHGAAADRPSRWSRRCPGEAGPAPTSGRRPRAANRAKEEAQAE